MQKLRDFARLNPYLPFFVLSGFVGGAWLAYSFPSNRLLILVPVVLFLGVFAKKKGAATLIAFLLFLALGSLLFLFPWPFSPGKGQYWGLVVQTKPDYYLFWTQGRRVYVYEKDTLRQIGDILKIEGSIKDYASTEYEGRFSFREYLRSQGVTQSLTVYSLIEEAVYPFRFCLARQAYLSSFDIDARALIGSLLFNDVDYTHPLLQEASAIGCLYFLSSSGLLYATFLRLFERMFGLRFEAGKTHRLVWVLAALLLPFSFQKAGVLRVFFFKSERLLIERGRLKERPSFFLVSDSGLCCLLINPFFALNTGFLISLGLSLIFVLSSSLFLKFGSRKGKWARKGLSLAVIFPMLISRHSIHLFSAFYALLLLPLIVPFAFLAHLGYLGIPLTGVLNHFATMIFGWIQFLSKIDISIPTGDLSEASVFIYYLCVTLFLYCSELGAKSIQRGIMAFLSIGFVFNVVPYGNALSQQISFLNVGQGDCIIIRDGFRCVMIDTGGNLGFDMAQEVDIPYLRKNRIYKVDCLIASHHDFDHIGAASSLQNGFRVKRFVDQADDFPLTIGEMKFTNWNRYGGLDENQRSLVLSLEFMDKTWLFTGDAPIDIEGKIVDESPTLRCDILKVGHHGSGTSSSERFLRTIQPKVGIISVGAKNKYGHPSDAVLKRFQNLGIPIRRTDQEGTITYHRLKDFAFKGRESQWLWKTSFLLREVNDQDRYNKPNDSIALFSAKPHG